ncbi:hypothetical protein Ppa06_14500 [Planomonospora parontospora subsp. parontospora]|uniref:Uncharacterized protein n=2 Tax=Planomonospora parontospora TaxID=58119 RepID=A0AA37BD91_9ACTN|nr:hypothetical protein [Planomonospora parontospora]GGK53326.1 hypothetical protein GCM10010126_11070 [Planomonospora parontospora]GII07652.1 hypothetical protein Ppa06_14500 [Planomonospora parontospora subsp. parontospora]
MSETPRHVSERAEERAGERVHDRPVQEAAETARRGGSPERADPSGAKLLADEEAAPEQVPEGSELVGREGGNELEGNPERAVSSQRLWDGSLSVSRLDETMPQGQDEDPAGSPGPSRRDGAAT